MLSLRHGLDNYQLQRSIQVTLHQLLVQGNCQWQLSIQGSPTLDLHRLTFHNTLNRKRNL